MQEHHEKAVRDFLAAYSKLEPTRNKMYDLFGCDGEFSEVYNKFIDEVMVVIQELVGDKESDWIGYFIYETDCGERPGWVKINDKEIIVDSVDKLIEVMKL